MLEQGDSRAPCTRATSARPTTAGAWSTRCIERHGRLDMLVNNAGITIDKPVLKMTDEDWYKVLAVNLSGAFFMSKAALPHMVERGTGRIVNISSIIGQQRQHRAGELRRVEVRACSG